MKKYAFLLVALFTLWACSDDDTTPQQEVTCSITAPAEGTIIDLATATSITIKGEGAVNVGEIESVTLKVNGKSVSEVTKVPFSYDYTFAADQAIGDMKIELTVKGDAGKEKTATAKNLVLILNRSRNQNLNKKLLVKLLLQPQVRHLI